MRWIHKNWLPLATVAIALYIVLIDLFLFS